MNKEKMTFKEINRIDVSDRVQQKMNLSYLSWAWAHGEMKKIDEEADIIIHEFPDIDEITKLANAGVEVTPELAEQFKINYKKDGGGAYVKVTVVLNGREETEYLPVMDFKNKSMTNPSSMDVNKAHKRAFVKALALHGLGLYIYAGEDLPEEPPVETVTNKQADDLAKKIKELSKFLEDDDAERKTTFWLVGKFSQGGEILADIEKAKFDEAMKALDKMIENNKPKVAATVEPTVEPTQESLLEGNTTKAKG